MHGRSAPMYFFRAGRKHAGAPRRWQVATGAEAAVRARGGRVRFSVAARHELSFVFFLSLRAGFLWVQGRGTEGEHTGAQGFTTGLVLGSDVWMISWVWVGPVRFSHHVHEVVSR